MVIGIAITIIGLIIGFRGSTSFNFGMMITGYIIALIGATVFATRLVEVWI